MIDPLIQTVSVHELKNAMEKNDSACVIDIREDDEWQEGYIPQALHVPKDLLPSQIHVHATHFDTPIYLYCRSGVRSLYAAQYLMAMGYTHVFSVNGGILAWAQSGYCVQQKGKP